MSIERDDSPIKSYHLGRCGLGEEITRSDSPRSPSLFHGLATAGSVSSDSPSLVCQATGGEGGLGQTHRDSNRYSFCLSVSFSLIVVVSRLREWVASFASFLFSFETFLGAIRMQFNLGSLPADQIERDESPREIFLLRGNFINFPFFYFA